MTVEDENNTFVQRLSFWKVLALELALLVLTSVPLIPNISSNLRYTRFFFQWPFTLWLIFCVAVMALIVVAILPLLWRALLGLPALEISGDTLTIFGLVGRSFKASEIEQIGPMRFGSLPVRAAGKIVATIPVWFYVDPEAALARLGTFQSDSRGLPRPTGSSTA